MSHMNLEFMQSPTTRGCPNGHGRTYGPTGEGRNRSKDRNLDRIMLSLTSEMDIEEQMLPSESEIAPMTSYLLGAS